MHVFAGVTNGFHLQKLMNGIRDLQAQNTEIEIESAKKRKAELKRIEALEEEEERNAAAIIEKLRLQKEREKEKELEDERKRIEKLELAELKKSKKLAKSNSENDAKGEKSEKNGKKGLKKKKGSGRASRGVALARANTAPIPFGVSGSDRDRQGGEMNMTNGMDRIKIAKDLKAYRLQKQAEDAQMERCASLIVWTI